jgi:lipoprotein-anchoring transpeptidase ErfK/SrfK
VPATPVEVRKAEPVLSDAPKNELEIALWQTQLERRHFSCGTIDGEFGMRSRRAIKQFQIGNGLPATGELDFETRMRLGTPGNPLTEYTVTAEDMAKIQPTPSAFRDKAKLTYLGYNDAWEMLGEKFHAMPDWLQHLNPTVKEVAIGTVLNVPNLEPEFPLPKAGRIEIILSETTLLVYDTNGRVVACFACSIAADKNKVPSGDLVVKVIAPDPNYTFNPDVLKSAAVEEGITTRLIIPPGPNNPVGLVWIGLSLPGYGIHGTPSPADISRTGSHGCFRLANWNALKLMKMVKLGVPVVIREK